MKLVARVAMKKPVKPPICTLEKSLALSLAKPELRILPTQDGEYLHWEELQYKQPRPAGLSAEEWWIATKWARWSQSKLPFTDRWGKSFRFMIPTAILPKLAIIDRKSGGIAAGIDAQRKDRYLVDSLIEEAISSSQLEGASTTRRVAKEMLLKNRKPHTSSEQMIVNNYKAMQFIQENKNRILSPEFILEIHRIVTENTLEDAGKLRTQDDIHVFDNSDGEILHTPPKAIELKQRLKILCDFANTDEMEEQHYIHPVIKAIILHFALAYDHPFSDGNGRTARALFYWFMLNRGYWLIEYISISHIIKKSPVQYAQAFLYTESDANDVTYFIFHQIKVIIKAIEELYKYIEQQKKAIQEVDILLRHNDILNHRQISLIQHALKNPSSSYIIEYYKHSHHVTYQTARTDLLKLVDLGLLKKKLSGKAFVFFAVENLQKKVEALK